MLKTLVTFPRILGARDSTKLIDSVCQSVYRSIALKADSVVARNAASLKYATHELFDSTDNIG